MVKVGLHTQQPPHGETCAIDIIWYLITIFITGDAILNYIANDTIWLVASAITFLFNFNSNHQKWNWTSKVLYSVDGWISFCAQSVMLEMTQNSRVG